MSQASPQPPRAVPNFRTARLVGIFNVLFSVQILLCGLCMGVYVVTLPIWGRVFADVQAQAKQQVERAKASRLAELDDAAKKADTPEKKAEIAALRKEVESAPDPDFTGMMDISKMGMTDPVTVGWAWVEIVTGLVLNTLMLLSGVGLMHWKPWSRKVAVWTAALKILRLVVVYSAFIVLVVPPMAKQLGDLVGDAMTKQQAALGRKGAAPPTQVFVQVYTVTYTLTGVGMMVTGVVYPALVVWLLTRPGVVSACSGAYRLPPEPKQPC